MSILATTRIYHPDTLKANTNVTLTPMASQHLLKVLRLTTGAEIILFNGQGGQFTGTLSEIKGRYAQVQVSAFTDVECESSLKIHLGQVLARGAKMDFIIQKAVELGVAEITPILSQRCGVKLAQDRIEKRMRHWQGVIISACEQCERNTLPKLNPVSTFDTWLSTQSSQSQLNLILDPQAKTSLATSIDANLPIALSIGPEGGFTSDEIDQACQHQFIAVNMGPRILRTETAGLAAIAISQALAGDLN